MTKGILGKKVGMTQVFTEDGLLVPVTVVLVTPNVVLQKKTVENDGYEAVQLGFEDKRVKLATKAEQGHVLKAKTAPKRYVREFRGNGLANYEVGQEVKAEDLFAKGDMVDVTGTSKGKGYQGVIRLCNWHTGPMGHGSKYHRGVGSMGSIDAARIFKGKILPGHMGHERVTVQNLTIVNVLPEKNVILIKGSIPGPKKSLVVIKNATKKSK